MVNVKLYSHLTHTHRQLFLVFSPLTLPNLTHTHSYFPPVLLFSAYLRS